MLVSAISAGRYQTALNTKKVNTRGGENLADTTFNSLIASKKLFSAEKNYAMFDSINEWKGFCHRQIENGNLDVIA